ncbi:MAG: hypothetical protein JKY71_01705 [Alphaproteobacteria bacterium]|nr:hypothetical protein [Alphaproteobacteria bacterium]
MILLAFIAATILPFMAPIVFRNVVSLGIYGVATGATLSFFAFGLLDETMIMTQGLALTIQLLLVISATHLLGVFSRLTVLFYQEKHKQPAVDWLITLAFAAVMPLAMIAA